MTAQTPNQAAPQKPVFVIGNSTPGAATRWTNEFRYEPPGVDVYSHLGSEKKLREKHGARIYSSSTRWSLSGSGYPQKISVKFDTIRRATDEDAAALLEIRDKLTALQKEFSLRLKEAWENGRAPHASEAVNYEQVQAKLAAKANEPITSS